VTMHQLLKDSTRKRHEQAEAHPFQGSLAQGRLPIAAYRRYVVQLAHLHQKFESDLHQVATRSPFDSVVVDEHYQLPFLLNDLKALGVSLDSEAALPCVHEFAGHQDLKAKPEALLGALYVLLGSKHGGKFIAHKVKESYQLGEAGYTYFNPYGENFRLLWQNFTAALNALPEDEKLRTNIVAGADSTFDLFVKIGEEIWKTEPSCTPG
jgi:heme oxygenase